MAVLPVGISGEEGDYQISRSLRFNSADSAYLTRTPGSAGNRQVFTQSIWFKRGKLATNQFLGVTVGGSASYGLFFDTNDILNVYVYYTGSVWQGQLITTQVFRDPSAWYHFVLSVDTTQATNTNRIKLYVNGTQVTEFSTANYPNQNQNTDFNNTIVHEIGRRSTSNYTDGYCAEINWIDGSALDPTSFGEFNTDTGVWQPKAYTGSYGTNGFFLDFADNTSTTTLGYDAAGSNDWTTNNFSVTAGAGNDSLVDSPTRYGTDTGAGGEVRGNYATLNKVSQISTSTTISNGNLSAVIPATSATGKGVGTIAVSSGKWYWETTYTTSNGNYLYVGMGNPSDTSPRWLVRGSDGEVFGPTTSGSATAIRFVQGDVIGIALDADNGKWFIRVNGTWQLSADPVAGTGFVHSGLYGDLAPRYENATSGASQTINCNFGQRPFAYTAPSGFKALVTTNLPTPTIEDGGEYFNTVLYTGNGSSGHGITGVGFQPDFTWIKGRSDADYNYLVDIVRTYPERLFSNLTDAASVEAATVTSSDSDGFTVGSDSGVNRNNSTYVAWNWKANGAGVSNTAGTITSTVSANTDAGFSIATFTTPASGTATVGHGLGTTPSFIILKSTGVSGGWNCYHSSLGATKYVLLQTTGAAVTSATRWNDTSPTSSVFTIGTNFAGSYAYVAYCFAPVAGYSAFGSYTGNGSTDGPFVYLGFRPRYLLVKSSTSIRSWVVMDSSRNTYNVVNSYLLPNNSDAEATNNLVDFTSNGFKVRDTIAGVNESSQTFIYAAFAENPFSIALAR